jgi:CBS domain-containing protein
MQVSEIMSRDPYCIGRDESMQHAAQMMKRHNVGALPVCDGERLVGIITDRDIAVECVASGSHVDECHVESHMTADPICVAPDTDAEEALQTMARKQVRRLCVTKGDRVVGMLSIGDLAVRLSEQKKVGEALKDISAPVRAGQ